VDWVFHVETGGLVWPDPGSAGPRLKQALEDCVPSLSPAGEEAQLSTYRIDHALSSLTSGRSAVEVIGDAWSVTRSGDDVRIHFDYGDEGDEDETVGVAELLAGLKAYREAVVRAIEGGHKLDGRWWAHKNPAGVHLAWSSWARPTTQASVSWASSGIRTGML
jgi:hypothetical protein